MNKLILISLLLTGCAIPSKHVKVLTSKTEINVKSIDIEDGDRLICDPEGCRVLR